MLVYLLPLILSSTSTFASTSALAADWSEGFSVPPGGRSNPYELSPLEFEKAKIQGKIHAQIYPVEVTGILAPYQPTKNFIEDKSNNPLKQLVQKIFQGVTMF
jgi:hypothetical protein